MEQIVSMLQQFGLNEKEANTYLTSLELGPSSIQKLARCARLNRSTVHFVSDRLRKKGLMGETRKGKKRLLFAEDPQKFGELLSQQKSDLSLKENILNNMLPILQNIEAAEDNKPKVQFYEGMQGFFDICTRSIEKSKKEILFLSSYNDFINVHDVDRYDNEYYIPTRIKKGIKIRMLVFENARSRKRRNVQKEELREMRYLPKNFKFKSTILIYGDEFSMISTQAPYLGVVIKSKELSHTIKQIYEIIWSVSR